jgi:hypothetical protein
MSKEDAVLATAKYRERYKDIGLWENEPMDGALACLQALKKAGYVLAMSTSKPKIFADQIVEKFGFSPYFSAQVGCGLDGSFPTKASVIAETMRQLSAKNTECLMVGDRFHDAEGAAENAALTTDTSSSCTCSPSSCPISREPPERSRQANTKIIANKTSDRSLLFRITHASSRIRLGLPIISILHYRLKCENRQDCNKRKRLKHRKKQRSYIPF